MNTLMTHLTTRRKALGGNTMKHETTRPVRGRQAGFSLPEALAGIAIFAIGILGLALLQSNLTRSQADASARGVATAISERLLERTRGFAHLDDDAGSGLPVYTALTAAAIEGQLPSNPLPLGGINYTVDARVFDYRWDATNSVFVCWPNLNNDNDARCTGTGAEPTLPSDYKLIEVDTSWTGADFVQQDDATGGPVTAGRLGSGAVTVSTVITSVPTGINAKVQTASDGNSILPLIPYTPGQAPDVIALDLGDNLRKESTKPIPEVLRSEYVETEWEVITYLNDGGDFFQRREEFIAVSCECTLKTSGSAPTSYTPVYWAGNQYLGGDPVTRSEWGVSANNQQSRYCDSCCRDHHDDSSLTNGTADANNLKVRPFDDDLNGNGNHKHYDGSGNLASNNSRYLESCRFVRKDGFFRLAQDMRQENLLVTPGDWLQSGGDEQRLYSSYLIEGVNEFYDEVDTVADYTSNPPCIGKDQTPACAQGEPVYGGTWDAAADVTTAFDSRLINNGAAAFPSWTYLNNDSNETQELRSRALYIDYMSYDLRQAIACIQGGNAPETCKYGDVVIDKEDLVFTDDEDATTLNVLALLPFSELQLTKLTKWGESPIAVPVDATSDPIEDNNTHSRGEVSSSSYGGSTISSFSYRGNLGLTDTTPVRPLQASTEATIIVQSVDASGGQGSDPTPPSGFTSINGTVVADNYDVQGLGGAVCDTPTGASYECLIPNTGTPQLRFYGYGRNNRNLYVCESGNLLDYASDSGLGTRNAETIFNLNIAADGVTIPSGAGWNLVVQTTACTR